MTATVVNLESFRKRKSHQRVFLALECLYEDALQYLANDEGMIDPNDWEAFMVQMLGEYLSSSHPESTEEEPVNTVLILDNYRRFDAHLRSCLHQKLNTNLRFNGKIPTSKQADLFP